MQRVWMDVPSFKSILSILSWISWLGTEFETKGGGIVAGGGKCKLVGGIVVDGDKLLETRARLLW